MKNNDLSSTSYTTDSDGSWKPLEKGMYSNADGLEMSDSDFYYNANPKKSKSRYYNALDPLTAGLETVGKASEAVGKGLDLASNIVEARAKRKEAEAKITEIAGKRQAQLTACEKAKENRFLLDPKKTRNRINDCKKEVRQRLDKEEAEQNDIIKRQIAIEEGKSSLEQRKSEIEISSKKTKNYLLIGVVVLIGLYLGGKMLKSK